MTGRENIIHLFIAAAEKYPQRTALIFYSKQITYAQLLQEVLQTAAAYKKRGVQKNDKILVFVPMSTDLYRVVLALFYIGACPVFLDEWVSLARLKECCRTVPCKGIIAGNKLLFLSWFVGELRGMKHKIKTTHTGTLPITEPPCAVSENDTALVTFTTGSTGTPKAANRTHSFLHAQYAALYPLIDNDADVSFVSLPIVVLVNLGIGKTTLLPPPGFSVKKQETTGMLVDDMISMQADEMVCSPSVVLNITKLAGQHKEFTQHVKYVFTGGGAVFPNDAQQIVNTFSAAACTVVYGSTEAEPISHIDGKILADVPLSVIQQYGLPVGYIDKNIRLALIPFVQRPIPPQQEQDWEAMKMNGAGQGEIVVAGNHVLQDYVNNPGAIAENKIVVDRKVWHRTGDEGRQDENGNLYLLGRCKEVIHHNNTYYYPLVSCYLFARMVGVTQAALFKRQEELILVMEHDVTPVNEVLLKTALEELYLQHATVKYLQKIPRDKRHNTKVDYEALGAMV